MANIVPGITKAERADLAKLVRTRVKVAYADAEVRGKMLLADAEEKLSAIYKFEDEQWEHITARVEELVTQGDAEIAQMCRDRGIPEDFRPRLELGWRGRGENANAARRAELRRLAHAKVDEMVSAAKLEIDRESERQLTQLLTGSLTTDEAKAFIGNMPAPEELLPPVTSITLTNGKVLQLGAKCNENVTDDRNAVTEKRNADADRYGSCASCGEPVASGRGLYCSNACRQRAWRRRRQTST